MLKALSQCVGRLRINHHDTTRNIPSNPRKQAVVDTRVTKKRIQKPLPFPTCADGPESAQRVRHTARPGSRDTLHRFRSDGSVRTRATDSELVEAKRHHAQSPEPVDGSHLCVETLAP